MSGGTLPPALGCYATVFRFVTLNTADIKTWLTQPKHVSQEWFPNLSHFENGSDVINHLYNICKCFKYVCFARLGIFPQTETARAFQLQMLLFPNALCCSLYERNCVCAVTKIFTKFLPANNFCQLLRVTRKHSCTSAGNAQAQLHFLDDQQRAFGISNISNSAKAVTSCPFSEWNQV